MQAARQRAREDRGREESGDRGGISAAEGREKDQAENTNPEEKQRPSEASERQNTAKHKRDAQQERCKRQKEALEKHKASLHALRDERTLWQKGKTYLATGWNRSLHWIGEKLPKLEPLTRRLSLEEGLIHMKAPEKEREIAPASPTHRREIGFKDERVTEHHKAAPKREKEREKTQNRTAPQPYHPATKPDDDSPKPRTKRQAFSFEQKPHRSKPQPFRLDHELSKEELQERQRKREQQRQKDREKGRGDDEREL